MTLASGQPLKLILVLTSLVAFGAMLVNRADNAQRLCGSHQVDIKKTKDFLGRFLSVSMEEGLRQITADFLKAQF